MLLLPANDPVVHDDRTVVAHHETAQWPPHDSLTSSYMTGGGAWGHGFPPGLTCADRWARR